MPIHQGRHSRHPGINAIIKRALCSADFLSQLEPTGIVRCDGKKTDGVILNPWSKAKCLRWDATVVSTMALSHFPATLSKAGAAATLSRLPWPSNENRRSIELFQIISSSFRWGLRLEARRIIRDIGIRIQHITIEPRAFDYLHQRISIEIQRGNAASVLRTCSK